MNRIKALEAIAPLPLWLYQYPEYNDIDLADLCLADLDFLAVASTVLILITIPETQF